MFTPYDARREIIQAIEAGGVVENAEGTYDIDSIIDEAYTFTGDHKERQSVDTDTFWEIVKSHELTGYAARLSRINIETVDADDHPTTVDEVQVFHRGTLVDTLKVPSSDDEETYDEYLADAGYDDVHWAPDSY